MTQRPGEAAVRGTRGNLEWRRRGVAWRLGVGWRIARLLRDSGRRRERRPGVGLIG
jgi:hypothetical protein